MTTIPSKVILITGSNRGLGREFVEQFLFTPTPPHILLTKEHFCNNDYTVVGCSRNIDQTQVDELNTKLSDFNAKNNSNRRFVPFQCDVTNIEQIKGLVEMIKTKLNARVDILVANAGIAENAPDSAAKSMTTFDADIDRIFRVNSVAPVVLTNQLAPFLVEAAQSVATAHGVELPAAAVVDSTVDPAANPDKKDTCTPLFSQCTYISSILGSITLANASYAPTYRASKAALNMYIRTLAVEYPQLSLLPLHPGWVATDMGSRGGRSPPVQPPQSIAGMLGVMSKYCTAERSGTTMYGFDDSEIPW